MRSGWRRRSGQCWRKKTGRQTRRKSRRRGRWEAFFDGDVAKFTLVQSAEAFQSMLETDEFDFAVAKWSEELPLQWLNILCAQKNCTLLIFTDEGFDSSKQQEETVQNLEFSPEVVRTVLQNHFSTDIDKKTSNFSAISTEEKTIS